MGGASRNSFLVLAAYWCFAMALRRWRHFLSSCTVTSDGQTAGSTQAARFSCDSHPIHRSHRGEEFIAVFLSFGRRHSQWPSVEGGSSISIDHSIISGNISETYGGGIYIKVGANSSATISESLINGNQQRGGGIPHRGGGIAIINAGHATVRDSKVYDNTTTNGYGGGIGFVGDITIERTSILRNTALMGGGIAKLGPGALFLVDSDVSDNSAINGGGISLVGTADRPQTILRSTITGNYTTRSHGFGGGIYRVAGNLVVRGSTISGNSAQIGGGINGSSTLSFSTVTDNDGAGIAGDAELNHTIVVGNRAVGGGTLDLDGVANSRFSLIGAGATFLGPLADNGGPTLTHALLPGSPATNAGDPTVLAGVGEVPEFDQRGEPFTRVYGGRIDIGALERQSNPLAGDYNFNGMVDIADVAVWRDTFGSITDLRADGNENGIVDEADRIVWQQNFGRTRTQLGAANREQGQPVREPFVPPRRSQWAAAADQALTLRASAVDHVFEAFGSASVRAAFRSR